MDGTWRGRRRLLSEELIMTSEELFQIDKKIFENGDVVIVSFGSFERIDELQRVDVLMFDHITEEIGQYDGHLAAVDNTHGQFFAYGRNAEELFKLMRPILLQFDFLLNAMVYLRFNHEDGTYRELEFILKEVA